MPAHLAAEQAWREALDVSGRLLAFGLAASARDVAAG
jgi:hypothetical protein